MKKFALTIFLLIPLFTFAQDDLMNELEKDASEPSGYTEATFKGTRLINGHSIETRKKGVLDVIISHRFGRINSGSYYFFGLDETNVRIGADYGISDRFNIGVGRNSYEKLYDGFLKYKILRQRDGENPIPVSLVLFSSMAYKTQRPNLPDMPNTTHSKQNFTFQAILARKFSPGFSFQISPTVIHRNYVYPGYGDNDTYAIGAGGRLKLSKRLSLNAEYFYRLNTDSTNPYTDAVAIGFDIETGGHVFQLHFTNARAMNEKGFITETGDDFFEGDIHFGFNISRTFQLH